MRQFRALSLISLVALGACNVDRTTQPSGITVSPRFAAVNGAAGCVQPAPGIVAWWRGEGNALDEVNGHDGTFQGNATYGAGIAGQGFVFDGQSWVEVPNDPAWNFGASAFTIELWTKSDPNAGFRPFISHDEGGGQLAKWIFWTEGALEFHINDPVIYNRYPVQAWFPGSDEWQHVAVTRTKNGDYTLYLDGAIVATGTDPIAIADANAPLMIGRAEAFLMRGSVDEPTIYNRALSRGEIQRIYNAGSAGKCFHGRKNTSG